MGVRLDVGLETTEIRVEPLQLRAGASHEGIWSLCKASSIGHEQYYIQAHRETFGRHAPMLSISLHTHICDIRNQTSYLVLRGFCLVLFLPFAIAHAINLTQAVGILYLAGSREVTSVEPL